VTRETAFESRPGLSDDAHREDGTNGGKDLRIVIVVIAVLLGLGYAVSGAEGLYFLRTGTQLFTPPLTVPAAEFEAALAASGFMWPLIRWVEVLGGLLLLTWRFAPLGAAMLFPVSIGIFWFHLALNPQGVPVGAAILAFNLVLLLAWRRNYAGVLSGPAAR
jgi:putative oxidoreductase